MPPKPQLWRLTFTCPATHADSAGDFWAERALSTSVFAPPRTADAKIEALFDQEPDPAALHSDLALFGMLNAIAIRAITIEKVEDLDWLKKVASDFPPLRIGRWTIFGAAHKDAVTQKRLGLQIDATSAFGTGEHPTTRGCLLRLDRLLKKRSPRSMLDMGCGSGILALAYAKARPGRGVGIDMDAASVAIAGANGRIGGIANRVRFAKGKGYAPPLVRQRAPYQLIMANIFARPLCEMAKDLSRHLAPGGYVILSGILNHQANAVIAAHLRQGLHLIDRQRWGEWTVLAFHRRDGHHRA